MESLAELYEGCRSYRRFQQKKIEMPVLRELAETAGRRSSAMNAQPLRFAVISSPEVLSRALPCLKWAARLPKEIGTPRENEQPAALIAVLVPEKPSHTVDIDTGIVLDTMAVTAWQRGIGSCIIENVKRAELAKILPVPDHFAIGPVLALGYPAHTSVIVPPDDQHGLGYYTDDARNYYVPKRPADEIIRYI